MEGFELNLTLPNTERQGSPTKMPTIAIWHARPMDDIVCNTTLIPEMSRKHCSFARATSCTTSYPYPARDHTEGTSMSHFVAVAVNMAAVILAMGVAPVL